LFVTPEGILCLLGRPAVALCSGGRSSDTFKTRSRPVDGSSTSYASAYDVLLNLDSILHIQKCKKIYMYFEVFIKTLSTMYYVENEFYQTILHTFVKPTQLYYVLRTNAV